MIDDLQPLKFTVRKPECPGNFEQVIGHISSASVCGVLFYKNKFHGSFKKRLYMPTPVAISLKT